MCIIWLNYMWKSIFKIFEYNISEIEVYIKIIILDCNNSRYWTGNHEWIFMFKRINHRSIYPITVATAVAHYISVSNIIKALHLLINLPNRKYVYNLKYLF